MPAVLGLALFLALTVGLAAALVSLRRWRSVEARALAFAVAWTLAEPLRGGLGLQFPWNPIAVVWAISDATLQTVAFFGTYGLSMLTVAAAGLTAPLFLTGPHARRAPLLGASALVLAIIGLGIFRLAWAAEIPDTSVRLRLVQANVAQHHKWDPVKRLQWFRRHLELSATPAMPPPRIVVWPESAVQLGLVTNKQLIAMSTWLEMKCYRRATLVTGQTQGIVADIQRRCPQKRVTWIPNGIDVAAISEGQATDPVKARAALGLAPGDLVLAYAGILGHAQGLEVVLNAARLTRDRSDIHYLLIGDGPVKADLIAQREREGLGNVRFVDRMPRAELLGLMRGIDAVVVPLRRNDLFKGAIPSKIFEALTLGKPLVLGVEGEAYELFIQQGKAGIAFQPENAEALAQAVLRYHADRALLAEHGRNGEAYVRANFDRRMITDRLWQDLQAITA